MHGDEDTPSPPTRRQTILDAAAGVFMANGFVGASMDEVAARARVSKQTVYKHFGDKESLFFELVTVTVEGAASASAALDQTIGDDVAADLSVYARALAHGVMQPEVLDLRRLVIAEAVRFPGLGRRFYELGLARTVERLAAIVADLDRRGVVRAPDVSTAAEHLNWLILSGPLNRAMLLGADHGMAAADIDRHADDGVAAFLRAYRP
ncbi:TetR/AcrR family transcriptional regulator [Iamia sp. SCSIO 61187]|uniref:TetR/AcrR family transcriptional regulator n=1 Tax=Iamia sp. SCSIO 61187 TaxID=2722752 RepID=UPI001C625490|nr:TetR/AcrR family transcriptional regulator [Iamia sp. SCSIO 61187]QYG94190.1 TetR/AcrR family transcriptional regulator [Iamia sp. SCSIO 61187]